MALWLPIKDQIEEKFKANEGLPQTVLMSRSYCILLTSECISTCHVSMLSKTLLTFPRKPKL
jgi:hypothetical protein